MRYGLVGLTLLLSALALPPASAETFADPRFSSELVTTVPAFGPVGVAWAPDGRMFIWQKNGVVRVLETDGALLSTPFLDFSSKVNTFNDNGMLGLAFSPDFETTGYIYLTYIFEPGGNPNDQSPKTGRLVRVTADPANHDRMLAGSEVVIMGGFPTDNGTHVLGTIRFAEDGTLIFGNGDGSDPAQVDADAMLAQNLDNIRGKFFRIHPDGTAPADNPFYDGTNSIRSKVWAYGVRNPYRFSLHPLTGLPYAADTGWNDWEEIDIVSPGANFGWPCYEGTLEQSGYQSSFVSACNQVTNPTPPIAEYSHSTGDLSQAGTCIVGGDFYTGTAYPAQYRGNYFYADYSGNWIHRVVLDAAGQVTSKVSFATGVEVPVSLEQGPDGLLYYVSFSTGQIRRIRYSGPTAVASATPVFGYSPLAVSFSSLGSGSPDGPLTYAWSFGDGGTSTLANPTHTYVGSGVTAYTATLTVRDATTQTAQSTVRITLNSLPPTPSITAPLVGTGYIPGQTVVFQGGATDPEQGVLAPGALSWQILLFHNTHSHTAGTATGSQGSFPVDYHGAIGSFHYQLILTATDTSGLSASTSLDIPVLADPTPPTAPSGLSASPAGYGLIDLSWTGSTDNAGVGGYRIERCAGATCSAFVEVGSSPTTTYRDAGLAGESTYRYRVRALDVSLNTSGYSNEASATTAPATQVPGLVAAYAFDEGSGSLVTDLSGNGNTGTLLNATWTNSGKYGGALSFNGTNAMVTVPSSASLRLTTGMTLEAWVRPTTVSATWRDVIYKGNDNYFLEGSSSSGGVPAGGGTFGEAFGASALPVNTWSHLAATYDRSIVRLYVNGAQVSGLSRPGTIATSTNPLEIGGDSFYGQYWTGQIDDVRVFNVARSATEIQSDMASSLGPPVPDTQPPTAPTLTATAQGATQIDLSWTGATDNVAVTSYIVERCQGTNCTGFAQIGSTFATAYSDTNLVTGTPYRYRVRAVDAAGLLSPYSNVASATTTAPDTIPPTAPTLGATAQTSTQIDLSWSGATDNVAVTGYRVERCQGAGCTTFTQIATPTGTTFGDTGLAPATPYSYRVRAVDAAGLLSPYSNVAGAATFAAPSSLVAAYAFDEASGANVTDASGNGNTGTLVNATRTTAGKYGSALSFNGTSARVTVPNSSSLQLTTAMTLEAWVRPTTVSAAWRDVIYKGNDNYYLEGTSTNGGAPAGGGTFGEAHGTAALTVNTWSHLAVTYDGSTIRLYVNAVEVSSQSRPGTIQASTNPLEIGGNSFYVQYWSGQIDEVRVYRVVRTAAEIQSDMNTPVAPQAPDTQPPTAPTLAATAQGGSQINLSWSGATDNVGVTGYLLERCQGTAASCTSYTQIATPAATTYNDTGLTTGTPYSYRVRATDAAGLLSPYSNVASATTTAPDTTPPTAPTLTATAQGGSQINLSWSGATDNVGVTGYRVERCQGAGCTIFTQIATPTATTYNDTGLAPGTPYSYRVRAVDAASLLSPYSNVAGATTVAASTLVAAYAFDEISGANVTDASGNANTGTLVNATRTTAGKYGGALTFNGTSARVNVPSSASLQLTTGMTLEAWVRPTTVSAWWRDVLYKGNDNYFLEGTSTSGGAPAGGGTFGEAFGTSALPVNTWSHLAVTYDGSTVRLFVNGVQVSSLARTGTIATSTSPLEIGGDSLYDQYWSGQIDEVRVFNVARTATEIQSDMATPLTPQAPDTQPPTAPTLSATAQSGSQINLSWSGATDNVGVTGYVIERCQGPAASCTSFTQIATPTGTTYNDTGLAPNTPYSYRARATDAVGLLSPYSNVASATTSAAAAALVAAYSFNENGGPTAADASGNGNTGTLVGATWTTAGRFGAALSFNGTTSRVTVPNSASLQLTTGMTLEAWVRPTAISNDWRDVIYKGNDNYFLEATSTNGRRPAGGITLGEVTGTAALTTNTWTHLAVTYDGSILRFYVNGAQTSTLSSPGILSPSTYPLEIGGDSLYGQYFSGQIDEVRIYRVARTAAEIVSDMASSVALP